MVHRSDKEDAINQLSAEEELGTRIRWGLQDSFSRVEPPDDVWPKILARVQEIRVPTRSTRPARGRRPSLSVTPFVQAVVVSALLLAFGLGVDRNAVAPRREYRIRSTPSVQKAASEQALPRDALSGYMLARLQQELLTHRRPGGAHP